MTEEGASTRRLEVSGWKRRSVNFHCGCMALRHFLLKVRLSAPSHRLQISPNECFWFAKAPLSAHLQEGLDRRQQQTFHGRQRVRSLIHEQSGRQACKKKALGSISPRLPSLEIPQWVSKGRLLRTQKLRSLLLRAQSLE